jgi:para-aminobenzoate synthetase component 1
MRSTIRITPHAPFHWPALQAFDTFLYRRVADRDREVLAVGCHTQVSAPHFTPQGAAVDWIFGHLCYDLKEQLEGLPSRHPPEGDFPLEHWFVPRWVIERVGGTWSLHALPGDEEEGLRFVSDLFPEERPAQRTTPLHWERDTSRERYLERAAHLLRHIQRGDIYELNYCTRRRAQAVGWDPYTAFGAMLLRSDAAFAGFHRLGQRFALCASPERFLSFTGDRMVGQPMKGTRPRSMDPMEDARLAAELAADAKERSENIMALDVMRHDLSRVAASGTVRVEELCAVRPHASVHQMTSTVSARLRPGLDPMDAVKAAFPMASMTGAPKYRAMQLIDEAEDQRRGLFSGTLGFFAPEGTADLNVVIRTILYDAAAGMASLTAGSALTATCDPAMEWEECELKARSVIAS